LPVHGRRFPSVVALEQVRRWLEEEYVYCVAWRTLRDGVMAPLALSATEMMAMPQVFLPFATGGKGQTLYEKMIDGELLLGPRAEEPETPETQHGWHTGSQRHLLYHAVYPSLNEAPSTGKVRQGFPWERIHPKYAVRDQECKEKGIDKAKNQGQGRSIGHVHRCLRDSSARRSFSLSRLRDWRRCPSS
jgi:hypothetical protein